MAFKLTLQTTQVVLKEPKTRKKTRGSKLAIWIVKIYSNKDYAIKDFAIESVIDDVLSLENKQAVRVKNAKREHTKKNAKKRRFFVGFYFIFTIIMF